MGLRIARAEGPLTDRWRSVPVESRGATRLGISFRPLQAESMGLEPRGTLAALLEHPYQVVRLAALWNRMEPAPDAFDPSHLDWQVESAERTGKQVIIAVGAVKNFGYPEFFVPKHHLPTPLREGSLVGEASHPELLAAALKFVGRVVERYGTHDSVVAWQVEHEAVDPLGVEHSWRLTTGFVKREMAEVKRLDPKRPILLNGFLPMSTPVAVQQWWRTRDQGDSLALAEAAAEIVGVDFYPCHALGAVGGFTAYINGGEHAWPARARRVAERAAFPAVLFTIHFGGFRMIVRIAIPMPASTWLRISLSIFAISARSSAASTSATTTISSVPRSGLYMPMAITRPSWMAR